MTTKPTFYSFRRCPYAMRARLALHYASIQVELREIVLKNKPAQMLAVSAKGTVPVLVLENGKVIDESLDIMHWALTQNDPDNWLKSKTLVQVDALITANDYEFKPWLDKYKYADRHPEQPAEYYRQQAEAFLTTLEVNLRSNNFLFGKNICLADAAIFPFIRQFSMVDNQWFEQSRYTYVRQWLNQLLASTLFTSIMNKYTPWSAETNNSVDF